MDWTDLPPASFAGIRLPVESLRINGGLRDHVHEYPHTPGGAPEKLGRKLYEIQIGCSFQSVFKGWDRLWPDQLNQLRVIFDNQETHPLVLPSIGTIQAYATSWDQEFTARMISGEKANFSFREDQSDAFLVDKLVRSKAQSIPSKASTLELEAEAIGQRDLFQQILDAAGRVQAVLDQGEAYGSILEARINAVTSLCQQADDTFSLLNKAENHRVLEALKELWGSAVELAEDILGKSSKLIRWTVPRDMSVMDVSVAFYGTADNSMQILQLNPIEDAFRIPAGTVLKLYQYESLAA